MYFLLLLKKVGEIKNNNTQIEMYGRFLAKRWVRFPSQIRNMSSSSNSKKRPKRMLTLKAPIEITDAAANRIKTLIGDKDIYGIRIGIRTRGCNGLSYTLNYAESKNKFEDEVKDKGVTVLIEPKAVMHIVGSTMDFVEDELTSEFVFHNPNAKEYCGCGESFTTG